MKLYVVGSAPQAQIQINSPYVSAYHADILLLDNGDIILTDKSKNGTFVNGNKVSPGKDVSIKRGDDVKFADVKLDWYKIPTLQISPDVKEIIGIGSHYLNKIVLSGDYASRFHATLKRKTDGKWYIEDHSKNGTKINGSKIASGVDVRLNRKDVIECAGNPVKNPYENGRGSISGFSSWIWGGVAAAAVVCVAVLAYILWPWSPERLYKVYSPATCMVICEYHYDVYLDGESENLSIFLDRIYDKNFPSKIEASGTGFFASKDGLVITNHHVLAPWADPEDLEVIKGIEKFLDEDYHNSLLRSRFQITSDKMEIRPCLDKIYVVPNGKIDANENRLEGRDPVTTSSLDVDLGYFHLVKQSLPEGANYVPLKKVSKTDYDIIGKKVVSVGFPMGRKYQTDPNNKPINAIYTTGNITGHVDKVSVMFDATIEHGCSGSPVFNDRGKLVGVAFAGLSEHREYNMFVHANLITDLLNKKHEL